MREIAQEWPGGAPPPHDPTSYVLVVDDESAVRDVLSRRLEAWGYDARKAGSAAEALELMVQKPASLVLCDVRMPGHDGLWLADRLRAHWPHTPVVMATAIDDLQTVRQSRESGAIDYVTKPISVERLREVVRRAATAANEGIVNQGITQASEVSAPPSQEPQTGQGIQGAQDRS